MLAQYAKEKLLSGETRTKLMDILADEIFKQNIPRGNASLSILAKKIIELFPNEDEVSKTCNYCYSHYNFVLFLADVLHCATNSGPASKSF